MKLHVFGFVKMNFEHLLPLLLSLLRLPEVLSVGADIRGRQEGRAGGSAFCYEEEKCKQGDSGSAWDTGTCAEGTRQSPINLPLDLTATSDCPLNLKDADYTIASYKVSNTGATLKVDPENLDDKGTFTHPINKNKYKLAQFHFHWGPRSDYGSEHDMGGRSYPLEMHLVHYNSEFDDIGAAVKSGKGDALSVIGIFFEVDSTAGDTFLTKLASQLNSVNAKDAEATGSTELVITDLLKKSSEAFVYEGSLTTPDCDEIVQWIVLKTPILIKESILTAFRSLKDDNGEMVMNFRKIQDLKGRTVSLVKVDS